MADGTNSKVTLTDVTNSGVIKTYFAKTDDEWIDGKDQLSFVMAGGIIGEAIEDITITGATNSGVVTVEAEGGIAGGIIGSSVVIDSEMQITNTTNTGDVTVTGGPYIDGYGNSELAYVSTAGGIVGQAIVGQTSGKTIKIGIINAKNTDARIEVDGMGGLSGGIVGYGQVAYYVGNTTQGILIEKAENTGKINSDKKLSRAGGIIGSMNVSQVTATRNRLDMQSFSLREDNRSSMMSSRSLSMGARSATGKKILVNKVMNTGVVSTSSGTKGSSGGIIGNTFGNAAESIGITNAGNTGKITAHYSDGFAGGIIGINILANMKHVYNHGSIQTGNTKGSLIGYLGYKVTIEQSYYLSGLSGIGGKHLDIADQAEGTPIESNNFTNIANFVGFESAIWQMGSNYPTLRP